MGEQPPVHGIEGVRGEEPTRARGSVRSRIEGSRGPFQDDLQSLFARAVSELAAETGCERVVAWSRDGQGRPLVLAARGGAEAGATPDAVTLERVEALSGPTDLGAPSAGRELAQLATAHDLAAAAPVVSGAGGAVGVLLLGGASEPPGRVRPRSLEALAAAAARIAPGARAALSAQRLASLDAEVQRLDRLSKLGELVAEIVHEIRNPLVSVKTFLQLLPEREDDPEFSEGFLEVASDELRRVERLLEVVLEHARPAPGTRQAARADVPQAFASVARLVAHRAAEGLVEIHTTAPEDLPPVGLAPDALRQLVLNLVMNALAVSPEQGVVRLDAQASGAHVVLCVEDDGPGIPPALRERLFQPFVSGRRTGVGGLGLAICQRIVHDAGGRIGVEAAGSGGARFVLELPRA